MDSALIKENYQRVLDRITHAAQYVGRKPEAVHLVVVTKGHPLETVLAVLNAGANCLGENYVEEALPKIKSLKGTNQAEWHMIGHVQSRKAQLVCEHFSWVHSLDSLKLAERLNRFAGKRGGRLPVLLECNVSGEESKFGWPAWDENEWDNLVDQIRSIASLPNLQLYGLMTMAPYLADPEETRPYFLQLRRLQDYLIQRLPHVNWCELSMGMSSDFEIAIQEGATLVRVGTAILGPRS